MADERLMRLVGQRIKILRQKAELTQEQMQDFGFNYERVVVWDRLSWTTQEQMQDFGFNYRYFQEIESGTANLTIKTLNRLAKAFKVSPIEFFKFD